MSQVQKEKDEKEPLSVRVAFSIIKMVSSLLDRIFRLRFSLAVLITGFLISVPVLAAWSLFVVANYLPHPWRAIMIWSVYIIIVIFVAAADYVVSKRGG